MSETTTHHRVEQTTRPERLGFLNRDAQVALLALIASMRRRKLSKAEAEQKMSKEDNFAARREAMRRLLESGYFNESVGGGSDYASAYSSFFAGGERTTGDGRGRNEGHHSSHSRSDNAGSRHYERSPAGNQPKPEFVIPPTSQKPSETEMQGAMLATQMFTDALIKNGWDGTSPVTRSQESSAFKVVSRELHPNASQNAAGLSDVQVEASKIMNGQRATWQESLIDDTPDNGPDIMTPEAPVVPTAEAAAESAPAETTPNTAPAEATAAPAAIAAAPQEGGNGPSSETE